MSIKPVLPGLAFALVLSVPLINSAFAETAITRAAMLANSCAACHGPDGHSPGAIPSIAGKSVDFITEALKAFRDGTKPATVMDRHAKGYTDEEIRLLADYFARQ